MARLKSAEFRRERQSSWSELERLVIAVESSGVRSLNARQLSRLPVLYRAALSSLSVARAISLDRALLEYLEGLCARAYFCVYGTTASVRNTFGSFFARRFPQAVRRFARPMLLSALFMALGAIVAFSLTIRDPDWFYVFVDSVMSSDRTPASSTSSLRDTLYTESPDSSLGRFASFLFTHNARIGLLAFALGFLAGVPVFLLLFSNGLILGAFAALFAMRGLGVEFWAWILPHGVTELLAIVLCGGAGLVLGHALVFPGTHSRLDNLSIKGREAGVVALGCVAMFFVAGLLEGFFRQLVNDTFVRYVVASVSAGLLFLYFKRCGRAEAAA